MVTFDDIYLCPTCIFRDALPLFGQEWEQYVPGFAQGMARKSRESRADLGFLGPVIVAIAVLHIRWVSESVEQAQY